MPKQINKTTMKKDLIAFKNWLWERKDISIPNSYVNEYLSEKDESFKKQSFIERIADWYTDLVWGKNRP